MTTSTARRVRTYSGTRHVTSPEAYQQVAERHGREEVSDAVAATIASWWQSPHRLDMPFTMLAQGSWVDLTDLLDAIHRQHAVADSVDQRALDMLATWAINYH